MRKIKCFKIEKPFGSILKQSNKILTTSGFPCATAICKGVL